MKNAVQVLLTLALFTMAAGVPALAQTADTAAAGGPAASPEPAAYVIAEQVTPPTYSDVNCAGYITNQPPPENHYVVAGWETPHASKFADRDFTYLTGGGYQVGAMYTVLRHLRDPNRWSSYKGQQSEISGVGEPFAEIAHVRIVAVRGDVGIAQTEFACEAIVIGDFAVPFVEKASPVVPRFTNFDRFAPPNGRLIGRIVSAKDFDQYLSTGRKAYLNIGAEQGVKVGDYFRVYRRFIDSYNNQGDRPSFQATEIEDTQKNRKPVTKAGIKDLPRRVLGEMVILSASPKSATGMVTFSLEDVRVGDWVEAIDAPPAPPAPVAEAMNPPVINCTATPQTVKKGESSSIASAASSPDNRPLTLSYTTSAGQIVPHENYATLDTSTAEPGQITVTCTATDDRNLSGSGQVPVNVEAAVVPLPSLANETVFKPGSAYVDNKAKAILDGIALLLQQQADATAVIIGNPDKATKAGARLAMLRAQNVKKYLTKSKGIDPKRIDTRAGNKPNRHAEIWIVPAGATMP